MSGEPVSDYVRSVILQSWERSKAAGADHASLSPRRVPPGELQERLQVHAEMLGEAEPQLEWLAASFDLMPDVPYAIHLVDGEGVLLCTEGNTRGKGSGEEMALGLDCSERSLGTNALGVTLAIKQPIAVVGAEHYCRTAHNRACCAAPIRDAYQNVIGAVGISTTVAHANDKSLMIVTHIANDISERLLHRQAVRDTESLRLVCRLSSFMAHELSNPLTALNGSLALLARRPLDERAKQLVAGCQSVIRQMTELVKELRALGGARTTDTTQIPVAELVEGTVRGLARPEVVQIDIKIDKSATVYGNRTLLGLAIANLARNAIEAMPEGGTVGVTARKVGEHMRITVWDTGPGISLAVRRQLFAGSVTTKEKGSGLGLLLVRAIVENAHGGRVSCAPNKPHGARFSIDLPDEPGRGAAVASES